MKKTIPVIIFGDHISAYGAIRGLSQYDIPIYMVSKTGRGLSTKSRFVKKILQLDPKDVEFIDKLNNWFDREIGVEAVLMVAGDDDYLDILAKGYNELRGEMKTTFPNWEVVKLLREKRHTYKLAEELGIPVPKTYHISSPAELENLLDSKEEKLGYPMWMKAEDSARFLSQYGNKGIVSNNKKELLNNYHKHEGFYGDLLIQDFIPGGEGELFTSLVTLNRKSQPTGLLINHKKRSSGPFLGGSLVATIWSDTVLDYSLKLLRRIGYYGYAGTQFKLDPRDGQFKLMEINGRMSMSNSLALKCGINLPYLMYQEALHGSLPVLEEFRQEYPDNILWWYLAGDLRAIIRNKEFLKPFAYIKSLIGRGYTIEPMNWRDPYPGIFSIIRLFITAFNKISRMG